MPVYRVRLARDGQELEVEGDKKFVVDMIAKLQGAPPARAASAATKASHQAASSPEASVKGISIVEFARRLGMKRQVDIVLAFGYYLEKHAGVSEFSAKDINNAYYEAKLDAPNTSQMLILNTRSGRTMESKGSNRTRKKYTLTRTGEKIIEDALSAPEK
jgi:hypothetical protein